MSNDPKDKNFNEYVRDLLGKYPEESQLALKHKINLLSSYTIGKMSEKPIPNEKVANAENRTNRDATTTDLYDSYLKHFKSSSKFKNIHKYCLFWVCIVIMLLLTSAIVAAIVLLIEHTAEMDILLGVLIPACVTYIGSLLGILKIIAKHLFQTNEEQNINDLVKVIIDSDLKGKKLDRGINE